MDFERWFKEGTSRFERVLIYCAAFSLVMVIVSQVLLTQPIVRQTISLPDRLEGEPYVPREAEDGLFLELSLANEADGSEIHVLINREQVIPFGTQQTVRIDVNEGDLIEIDGKVPNEEIEIVVSAVSQQLATPQQGKVITFFGRPETVSYVIVERN